MRPNTLAEAIDLIIAGEPQDIALAEFVDTFAGGVDAEARYAMLSTEPRLTGDAKLDALCGAMAEYLAKQFRLGKVPPWAGQACRHLAEPWFTTSSSAPQMHEYLAFTSPAEFRSRNIFTEERPLRRARTHRALQNVASA